MHGWIRDYSILINEKGGSKTMKYVYFMFIVQQKLILLEIPCRISPQAKIYIHSRYLEINRDLIFEGGHRPKIENQG